jgi:hypothetical protein
MNDQPTKNANDEDREPGKINETPMESSGEVIVQQYPAPPPGPKDKQIHSRKPLPPVPPSKKE